MKALLIAVMVVILGGVIYGNMNNSDVDKATSIEGLWPHRIEHIERMNTLDADQASFERQVATAMRQEALNQSKNVVGIMSQETVNTFSQNGKEVELEKKVLADMKQQGDIQDFDNKVETMHNKTLKAQTATLMDKAGKLVSEVMSTMNEVIDDPSNAQATVLKGVGKVLQGQKNLTASADIGEVSPVKP